MPIVFPLLGRLVTGMLTLALGGLKMNRGHAQSLGLWHPLSGVGTPPTHDLGMVLITVARNTHTGYYSSILFMKSFMYIYARI